MLDMIQLFLLTLYNLHPVETERERARGGGVSEKAETPLDLAKLPAIY